MWSVLDAEVYYIPGVPIGFYKYETVNLMFYGDTVINAKKYKILYSTLKKEPIFPTDWKVEEFLREENKKVWKLWWGGGFYEELLFDFSYEVGDTVNDNLVPPLVVGEISYKTMLDGKEYKLFRFSTGGYFLDGYWIEGIGSDGGPLIPFTEGISGGFYELLCLHENEKLVFFNDKWGTCYKSSVGVNTHNNQFKIYPNPANDVIIIENTDNLDVKSIIVTNIQGQMVRQYEPTAAQQNVTQLNVADITSGLYFIKIVTENGIFVQKILINK